MARYLLEIFNGINARVAENRDHIDALEQQLRAALVLMQDIACELAVFLERQRDEHNELSNWHTRQMCTAQRAENAIDSQRAAIGRLIADIDHYDPEGK